MKIITITREYGAGGREIARQLAEALGWRMLDRELLHEAAEVVHVPDAELERLDEKAISMVDRFRLHPPHQNYLRGLKTVIGEVAQQGQVVLVGRGARHILADIPEAFHLRLVAPRPWRAQRMARIEGCTLEEATARCTEIDRIRQHFTRYFFGDAAMESSQYDLVVNTSRVDLDDVTAVVASLVRGENEVSLSNPPAKRVLTLSRELGAGETSFAPSLGERLHLHVYDRELLEQEAVRLGISEADLEKIDEQPAGIFQRFRPGSLYQRYIEALGQLMHELADRGDVILVGRGGSCFLRSFPGAFHVRLMSPMPLRLRRVMEYRWVRENVARSLISQADAQRRSFYESYFGADWSNPLEYHLTVNSGRLGTLALELVGQAGSRYWNRTSTEEKH